jgi:hypothetical protein
MVALHRRFCCAARRPFRANSMGGAAFDLIFLSPFSHLLDFYVKGDLL